MYTAAVTAPTTDEPAHLAAGLYLWNSGKCDFYPVNPPFVKAIAAVPLVILDANRDWSEIRRLPARPEMDVGISLMNANGKRFLKMVMLARWICVPFSLIGGFICYLWSNRMFGPPCGIVALTLWCFSPTILGNGALATADVPGASAGILAGFVFWQWLDAPSWEKAVLSGVTLGLCWLTKLTWVVLPAIWLVVWLARRIVAERSRQSLRTGLGQIAAMVAVGLAVLNVGYAFEGTMTPLGEFRFTSTLLSGRAPRLSSPLIGNRFEGTPLSNLPLPLPSPFVYGLDAQKQDFEETRRLYFAGELGDEGWWYFYVVAFFLKETPPTLVLGFLAIVCFAQKGARIRSLLLSGAVWIPPLGVLLLVSTHLHLNYYRYLLPALPYVLIWVSQAGRWIDVKTPVRAGVVIVVVLAAAVSGARSVPHSLSYVNLFRSGKPGHWWFADCNYDWGQDLYFLKRWLNRHPEANHVRIGYFGPTNPHLIGLEFDEFPRELIDPTLRSDDDRIPPGWYAISVSHLRGIEGSVPSTKGGIHTVFNSGLRIFESVTPIDRAAPSILIYRIK